MSNNQHQPQQEACTRLLNVLMIPATLCYFKYNGHKAAEAWPKGKRSGFWEQEVPHTLLPSLNLFNTITGVDTQSNKKVIISAGIQSTTSRL